ncbi:MAG: transposase, partial [Parcubacteria group bacterium]|nr:transposase [Parcubacteria group bacterium]
RRKIPFSIGEYYHVYNRGTDKRVVFIEDRDYRRFIFLLYICNSVIPVRTDNLFQQGQPLLELFGVNRGDTLVDIGAFCLMPNHFHLLLYEKTEGGISIFMKKLLTAYVMYFNTKNERRGSLFEGPFKAKYVNSNSYLNWIFSYIHLNPVKLIQSDWKESGILDPVSTKNFVDNYKYSSYYDYFLGDRSEGVILNKKEFSDNFSQLNDFEDLVQEFREVGQ